MAITTDQAVEGLRVRHITSGVVGVIRGFMRDGERTTMEVVLEVQGDPDGEHQYPITDLELD